MEKKIFRQENYSCYDAAIYTTTWAEPSSGFAWAWHVLLHLRVYNMDQTWIRTAGQDCSDCVICPPHLQRLGRKCVVEYKLQSRVEHGSQWPSVHTASQTHPKLVLVQMDPRISRTALTMLNWWYKFITSSNPLHQKKKNPLLRHCMHICIKAVPLLKKTPICVKAVPFLRSWKTPITGHSLSVVAWTHCNVFLWIGKLTIHKELFKTNLKT